jgi:hypothetical protein
MCLTPSVIVLFCGLLYILTPLTFDERWFYNRFIFVGWFFGYPLVVSVLFALYYKII